MDATDLERKARREKRQDARREIPEEWISTATNAVRDYWAQQTTGVNIEGEARAAIAAVRPLIERAAREDERRKIAEDEILPDIHDAGEAFMLASARARRPEQEAWEAAMRSLALRVGSAARLREGGRDAS